MPALRARLRPVCVAVASQDADELFRRAEAALEESAFLELRFDALDDPRSAVVPLRAFCIKHPEAAVLATCRRTEGGGAFCGSVEEQLALLRSFAEAGALLVDVEVETLEAARPEALAALRGGLAQAGASLLVSAHDFAATGDPEETLRRLRVAGAPAQPAIYKVVTTATSLADNLRMLRFVGAAALHTPIVGICMGMQGLPSRALALRSGALFTFASAAAGQPTAPGQV